MLSYTMVGTNNLDRAERFYNAILLPLGYEVKEWNQRLIYAMPGNPDMWNGPGAFYVTKPFDGNLATVGNGTMVAFRVEKHAAVHSLHAAGVTHGGTDAGAPGFREMYGRNFYVGYLRDPDNNKVAVFCTNPGEPARPE